MFNSGAFLSHKRAPGIKKQEMKIECCYLKNPRKEADLKELCDFAVKNEVTRTKVIDAGLIVIDERIQLNPPCLYYGKKPNYLCLRRPDVFMSHNSRKPSAICNGRNFS